MKIGFEEAAERGIELCKQGYWDEGLVCLQQALQRHRTGKKVHMPPNAFSYLGFALAYRENKAEEGVALCRQACETGYFDADNYMNLARTCLLAQDRKAAFIAVEEGLRANEHHHGLLTIKQKLGTRRKPVLPFLSRSNVFNILLGKFRHELMKGHDKRKLAALSKEKASKNKVA